jgi:hypothetical protein
MEPSGVFSTDPSGVARQALALPDNAWGRHDRRGGTSRRSPLDAKTVLGVIFSVYGIVSVVGAVFLWAMSSGSTAVPQSYFEIAGWSKLIVGPVWIALGASVWRAHAARVRKSVALLILLAGAEHAVEYYFSPGPYLAPPWVSLPLASACGLLGLGVWFAREWGRRGCIVFGPACITVSVLSLVVAMSHSTARPSHLGSFEVLVVVITGLGVAIPMMAGPGIALAIYSMRPSTRQHFAEARDAMAHARTAA